MWTQRAYVSLFCLFVALLALAAAGTGPGMQDGPQAGQIVEMTPGKGNISSSGETHFRWLDDSQEFLVTLSSNGSTGEATVCVMVGSGEAQADRRQVCKSTTLAANGSREVTVRIADWPVNLTGKQVVDVTLRVPDSSGRIVDRDSLSVVVIPRDGDLDGDGLANEREVSVGTNLDDPDTDGDGLEDGAEVDTFGTSPANTDTDDDGLTDAEELDEYRTDPTETDTDEDGLSDGREIDLDTNPNTADTDGDGLEDGEEVTTYQTDPTDPDTDDDGLQDGAEATQYGTDPLVADTDGDGLEDGPEVNQHGTDPTTSDTDDDGQSDFEKVRSENTEGELLILAGATVVPLTILGVGYWVVTRHRGRSHGTAQEASSEDDSPEPTPPVDVPTEFLSNGERVLLLLEEHDGQVRQSTIVEETDWSKSKVSRVLSEMEADGEIAKVDVGRGNVILRPEDETSESD